MNSSLRFDTDVYMTAGSVRISLPAVGLYQQSSVQRQQSWHKEGTPAAAAAACMHRCNGLLQLINSKKMSRTWASISAASCYVDVLTCLALSLGVSPCCGVARCMFSPGTSRAFHARACPAGLICHFKSGVPSVNPKINNPHQSYRWWR